MQTSSTMKPTVSHHDIMHQYLENLRQCNYTAGTIRCYRYIFQKFEKTGFTIASIQRFQDQIITLSPATRSGYLGCLRKILKKIRPELVKVVIVPKVPKQLPRNIPDQNTIKEILQQPDTGQFAGVRDKAILELLYSSGLRRMEMSRLMVDDVDLIKQIVRVNQGKMRKDRLVPISERAAQWIKKYIDHVRSTMRPKSNHLFLGKTGTGMNVNAIYEVTRRYSEYSTHAYRHAYSTHLLQNGMKETSLQRLLGHSQITTTERYTHVSINDLKMTYKKLHTRDQWLRKGERPC